MIWATWREAGSAVMATKHIHLIDRRSDATLCGIDLPEFYRPVLSPSGLIVNGKPSPGMPKCERCQERFNRL